MHRRGNAVYVYEGMSAQTPIEETSLMRQPYNWDSENNYNDFILSDSPSPANSDGDLLLEIQDPDPGFPGGDPTPF